MIEKGKTKKKIIGNELRRVFTIKDKKRDSKKTKKKLKGENIKKYQETLREREK